MNIIRIKAFPGAKKDHVEVVSEHVLRIFVREAPERNMANKKVLKLAAAHYGIAENRLRIIAGHQHLNKTVQILG